MNEQHILTARDVAKLLGPGWNTRKAKRWLQATGAGVRRGSRWITTPQKLVGHWPEAFERIAVGDLDCAEPEQGCESCDELRSQVRDLERAVAQMADRLARYT